MDGCYNGHKNVVSELLNVGAPEEINPLFTLRTVGIPHHPRVYSWPLHALLAARVLSGLVAGQQNESILECQRLLRQWEHVCVLSVHHSVSSSRPLQVRGQLSEVHDRSIRFAASVNYNNKSKEGHVLRVRSRMSASFKDEAGRWWFRPLRGLEQLYDRVYERVDVDSLTQFWCALDAWMDAKQDALDERHQSWLRRLVQLNVATPAEQEKRAREQLVDRCIHDFTLSRANADLLSRSLQSESSRLSFVEKLAVWYWMLDPARRRSFADWHRLFQGGPAWDQLLHDFPQ